MLTKKDMVNKVAGIYGQKAKMSVWFEKVSVNNTYAYTQKIFSKIMKKSIDNKKDI